MANSLLDFVMSVVRDPDAAAAYAANPAQAIADANLTDVTSIDVNNLIPVVAESISATVPSGGSSVLSTGADTLGDSVPNVWASGAATAAFDAFGDQLPLQVGEVGADHLVNAGNVIDLPEDAAPTIELGAGSDAALFDQAQVTDAPAFDDVLVTGPAAVDDAIDGAHHLGADQLEQPQDPAFDIFT